MVRHGVAVIGAGPAGLMAAETISAAGIPVTVFDRMPSAGRKLLMAGRGGLNLTHSEPEEAFGRRYGAAAAWMRRYLAAFPPAAAVAWAEELGQPTFVGSSGRVFPKAMKASPLLRSWLARLAAQGVAFRLRRDWTGWDAAENLVFRTAGGGTETFRAEATVLALGGASWPRLGSNGAWWGILAGRGVEIVPFAPANAGFEVAWSAAFAERFAGSPLKNLAVTFRDERRRGELVITRTGIEGGLIYAFGPVLRDAITTAGTATIAIDLWPDLSHARLAERLAKSRPGDSLANRGRHAGLTPAAINLVREAIGPALSREPAALAAAIKALPLHLRGPAPLDRAISTAGGIALAELDEGLMLRRLPGIFAAGEMLDWEAPTGGYLLQGCLATGRAAGLDVLNALSAR